MGSLSIWHWLIVLLVIVLVFGTKKLKNVGSDLGAAVKGFKDGVKEGGAEASDQAATATGAVQAEIKQASNTLKDTIDVEAKQKV